MPSPDANPPAGASGVSCGPDDAQLTEAHVAHWVVRSLQVHFAGVCGEEAVDAAIRGAGLEPARFAQDGWVSYTFLRAFLGELLARLTGEPGLPAWSHPAWQHLREAGRRNFDPEIVGPLFPVLRLLGSPEGVYRMVPRVARQGNRVMAMDLLESGPGRVVLRAVPLDPAQPDHQGACWNRLGLLEAVPTIWGLPLAEVEHRECMHHPLHPAPACVYRVRFQQRPAARAALPLAAVGAGAAAGAGLAVVLSGPAPLAALAGGALAGAAWALWELGRSRVAHRRYASQVAEALEAADARYEALWREGRALHRANLVTRKVAAYLAQDLVERIVEHPELELALGGARVEAAVLFADIVGFTRRSLGRPPEEVVAELNTWFGGVDPVVAEHGGVIDKRLGDGLMVVFTSRGAEAPEALRRRAVDCGLALLRALPACNRALVQRGRDPLRIRVGLAAGPLVLGNMGSELRLEYTVIGDVVNIAARLQGLAEPDHLLIERSCLHGDPPPGAALRARRVAVRGVGDDVDVLELCPAGEGS